MHTEMNTDILQLYTDTIKYSDHLHNVQSPKYRIPTSSEILN